MPFNFIFVLDLLMFENKIKTLTARGDVALGVGMPDASEILAKLSVDTGVYLSWIS